MINRFILNEVSYFGPGARKELPTVVKSRGFKKALVVTDKGLMKFGVAKMVLDVLDEANIPYEVYDDVKPNPTVTNVTNGVEACKKAEADFIVAIGGGSSMDTAKGIGIVCTNPEFADVVSLEGIADTKKQMSANHCPSYNCRNSSRDNHQLCNHRREASAEDGLC
jgi:lactaldehyde reductase